MIRQLKIGELDSVMKIWLETNIKAHDFINKSYWQENYAAVKEILPNAEVFVYEENHIIRGFIGLMQNYIAGIFVDADNQSRGVGKALLDSVKENHSELSLQAYKKNVRALKFYRREEFAVTKAQIDQHTGEEELVMKWTK